MKPLLKWVGGKQKLVPTLVPMLPGDHSTRRHVEPFAGAAALFFATTPQRALLSDVNGALMSMYETVKECPALVLGQLKVFEGTHSKERYYELRDQFNEADRGDDTGPAVLLTPMLHAALFVYFNKTCFNGIWRVNKAGRFNVPIGRYTKPPIYEPDKLASCSEALQKADVRRSTDFATICDEVGEGDFVYLDPPYMPVDDVMYVGYAAAGFKLDDHVRLRDAMREMTARGAKVMASNSDSRLVRELYGEWKISKVETPRSVSRNASQRGKVTELVIRNY